MKISSAMMPLFALLAGVAGFYIRLQELWSVIDARTGLPQRGAALTLTLIALTVAFILLLLIFSICVSKRYKSPEGFEYAFGTEMLSYPVMFAIIGIIWIGASVKYYIDLSAAGNATIIEIYFSAFSVLAAISTALCALVVYQGSVGKTKHALCVIPVLFMCFWLVLMYRENATNPVLLSYAYFCLAIMFATLGFYFTAGFLFNKPASGKTVFCSLTAVYFCLITLADKHVFSIKLIFFALIAINMIHSSMLIKNLEKKN